jgi:hypothetical protein
LGKLLLELASLVLASLVPALLELALLGPVSLVPAL